MAIYRTMKAPLKINLNPSRMGETQIIKSANSSLSDSREHEIAHRNCHICLTDLHENDQRLVEEWSFDDQKKIQKLDCIIPVCENCLMVKKISKAFESGNNIQAIRHLMKVNNWNMQQADDHVTDALQDWQRRTQYKWTLDLRWLDREVTGPITSHPNFQERR